MNWLEFIGAVYLGYFIGVFITFAGGILILTHCGARITFVKETESND